ncbi:MAG TPA: bifunctional precorrin-2 dehydrogenase/sirohydrochlorin ferrochelatase [Oligoflexus sp.]|uniref:precorrin-2 dehydrogenase/sirohydrochlorin ferrochelatase family protein n=1 Tax=Oligoflexus sp. TaxID=1971216 RepID=UPI002D37F9F4|nr:bifunctional precorrin-2 dehydrogenase/sirohydrochlorin ferrochelatase [Oligoflexus sp.]HYX31692.1 bifunctional precorrin-2 dehydrogenase/sirohydrochlorin ferrochelatase [Oligoflexus sp.]
MSFLPIFIDLKDKPVLLIGGGAVAREKLEKLIQAEARVRVIARVIAAETRQLLAQHHLSFEERPFFPNDVTGHVLVISAVNDSLGHARIAAAARARGILVNAVDEPASADFFFGAQIERGPLQIAISTQGLFPGVARALRLWLEEALPEDLSDELGQLAVLRKNVRHFIPDPTQRMRQLKEQLQIWQKSWLTEHTHYSQAGESTR